MLVHDRKKSNFDIEQRSEHIQISDTEAMLPPWT